MKKKNKSIPVYTSKDRIKLYNYRNYNRLHTEKLKRWYKLKEQILELEYEMNKIDAALDYRITKNRNKRTWFNRYLPPEQKRKQVMKNGPTS